MWCQEKDSDIPLIANVMVNKSRLRVQKKRGGLIKITVLLVCVVGLSWWQAEKIVPVLSHLASIFEFSSNNAELDTKKRGVIYDRNFKEMATSLESVSVYGLVREVDDPAKTALKLAAVLEKDPEEIMGILDSDDHRVWIAKNIDQVEEEDIRALNVPGIFLHSEIARYYPEHKTAAHILGFSEGDHGLAGVEYKYDLLVDKMQTSPIEEDGFISSAQATPLENRNREDYRNLVLTIDLKIQKIVENFVEELGKVKPGVTVGACMIEGKSGAIVGSANFPSYDPNFFRDYDSSILNNILLKPISVPVNLRAALRDAVQINRGKAQDQKLLPWSVSAPVIDLGAELRMWGPLGLEGNNEFDFGLTDGRRSRNDIQFLKLGVEQDTGTVPMFASPVQLVAAISSLINGGKKIVPYAMDRLVDESGERGFGLQEGFKNDFIVEPEVSSEISKLFFSQAQKGPLGGMYLFGNSTQFVQKRGEREYSNQQLVIAPIPFDKPDIVFLLVIKDVGFGPVLKGNKHHKNTELAQSMNELLPSLAALQQVMKNLSDMMTVAKSEEKNLLLTETESTNSTRFISLHDDVEYIMPDLIGHSLRKSLRLLSQKKVQVTIKGTGVVVSQNPKPGTPLKNGEMCQVNLSSDGKGLM